jgi:hypothetical protein
MANTSKLKRTCDILSSKSCAPEGTGLTGRYVVPEGGDSTTLINVGDYIPVDTA